MELAVAIIADDLTGALDTATPFLLAGKTVAVALGVEGIDEAVATGAQVVAVNTASRALPPSEAATQARRAADAIARHSPSIAFKKIDSRLKGNIAVESAAVATGLGRARLLVAPAIPDQSRLTVNGCVTGRGVDAPIAIAPLFEGLVAEIADAASDDDLARLVASSDAASTLFVGARGLGLALAGRGGHGEALPPARRTLFAIASRDPITRAQIDRLAWAGMRRHDAPDGAVPKTVTVLPAVVATTGFVAGGEEATAARFANGIAALVLREGPDLLVTSGGDTALAILTELGVGVVLPRGEAAPGLPWFSIVLGNGKSLCCVVKSGGFGGSGALAELVALQGAN